MKFELHEWNVRAAKQVSAILFNLEQTSLALRGLNKAVELQDLKPKHCQRLLEVTTTIPLLARKGRIR
jgi:hypothetical protein